MDRVGESFLNYFQNLEDPRSKRNRLHTMSEILLVALSAAIHGVEDWMGVESYGRANVEDLRKYLPYENGTPSDDTLRRFFRAINLDQFQELFRNWIKSLQGSKGSEPIAMNSNEAGGILRMMRAYATEARIAFGQEKVLEEEQAAIPK